MTGVELIIKEKQSQIFVEDLSVQEYIDAIIAYAEVARIEINSVEIDKSAVIRNLVSVGALTATLVDKLQPEENKISD